MPKRAAVDTKLPGDGSHGHAEPVEAKRFVQLGSSEFAVRPGWDRPSLEVGVHGVSADPEGGDQLTGWGSCQVVRYEAINGCYV